MENDPERATDFKVFASFEDKDEFLTLRDRLLSLDIRAEPTEEQKSSEWDVYKKITMIVSLTSMGHMR